MGIIESGAAHTTGWGIIVHGGAGRVPPEGHAAAGAASLAAARAAAEVLVGGGAALDAVQRAVELLEDDPIFNAGRGSSLTSEGRVELDAAIMDGETLRAGAVCALPPFQNPVAIARAVLDEGRHVLYAGEGAARFAEAAGFVRLPEDALVTDGARARLAAALVSEPPAWGGTVGAVALDGAGRIAAATSTGGTTAKRPGRVGDSPLLGAGTYADSAGGASATGHGEGIMRVALTSNLVSRLRSGEGAEAAARIVLDEMQARVGSEGGVIAVDRRGLLAWAHTSPALSWAWVTPHDYGCVATLAGERE
ncbi:MAG: hypothetical protein GX607_22135 [Myxococcales bacterium]|nr:hypothetical protein [Myxococcales bacterium]